MAGQSSPASSKAGTSDREIVLSRVFDAPRELVFKAWTDSRHIAEWWGPNGFTTTVHEMDVRPGGVWRFVMHSPDGIDFDNMIVFHEVVEPERLVYDHTSGPHHRTTITLEDMGDERTKLTFTMVFETMEHKRATVERYKADIGLKQTLGRLEDYLVQIERG